MATGWWQATRRKCYGKICRAPRRLPASQANCGKKLSLITVPAHCAPLAVPMARMLHYALSQDYA
jgi:hypothetical protein